MNWWGHAKRAVVVIVFHQALRVSLTTEVYPKRCQVDFVNQLDSYSVFVLVCKVYLILPLIMTTLPASSPLTQFLMSRRKPQAKSLSPAARSLFGKSDASLVKGMLAEVLMTDRRKGISELNFDIYKGIPVHYEQQENISDLEKTAENRRRYQWKAIKLGEAPEYYSRAFAGKRSLIPADLSKYSTESVAPDASLKQSKRNPFGGRSFVSDDHTSNGDVSPLRSPPAHFCDSAKFETIMLQKPLAVHATSVNALTVKNVTPSNKISSSQLFQRSPLTQRNQSGFCRALNFISTPTKSTSKSTNDGGESQSSAMPISETSSTSSEISLRTPKSTGSAHSAMKQLKITDMVTIRKPRSPAMKARKRLRLQDETEGSPQPKSHKLVNHRGVSNAWK